MVFEVMFLEHRDSTRIGFVVESCAKATGASAKPRTIEAIKHWMREGRDLLIRFSFYS
jgi:hypothetical protein